MLKTKTYVFPAGNFINLRALRNAQTTASLIVSYLTFIFRSLTRTIESEDKTNTKHALNYGISFAAAKYINLGALPKTKLFSEAFRIK